MVRGRLDAASQQGRRNRRPRPCSWPLTSRILRLSTLTFFLVAFSVVTASPVGAGSTIFADSFTDADHTTLHAHNSLWLDVLGEVILDNRSANDSSSNGLQHFMPYSFFDTGDQCTSIDISFPIPSGQWAQVGTRFTRVPRELTQPEQSESNYPASFFSDGRWEIDAGDTAAQYNATVASGVYPQPTVGIHTIKLCSIGSTHTLYLDNATLGSGQDNHISSGAGFFRIWQGSSADNFLFEGSTNATPVVGSITVSPNPIQVNSSTSASASFTDANVLDTHTATWNWGDGTACGGNPDPCGGAVAESNGTGSVTGSHTYAAAGVYTVSLTVADSAGASDTSTFQYASAYNPTAQGLFSAGRRFNSPIGAYAQDQSLTGNVLFGLSYKYQGTVPVGNHEFTMNFPAANLVFNATTISSLVISNGTATLTGTGNINGSGSYNFAVVGVNGGGIRIDIVSASGTVIYDTQPGAAGTATPTTFVTGQVVVH
jgi:hypothetical protein